METQEMTQCTKCGTPIKNIIMIEGKPYGTECATTVLGIRQLPSWFKGGDWNKAKAKYDLDAKKYATDLENALSKMNEYWDEWQMLSKIATRAYRMDNDWLHNFIVSIIEQLGYPNYLPTNDFKTASEAFANWKPYDGSFPVLYHQPRRISDLSEKQQYLITKNI